MKVRKLLRWRVARTVIGVAWKATGLARAKQGRHLHPPPNGGICQQEKQPDSHSGNLGSSPSTPAIFMAHSSKSRTPGFHPGNDGAVPSWAAILSINIRGTPLGAIRMLSNENHGRVWGRCHWDAGSIPAALVCVSNKSIASIWEQVNDPIYFTMPVYPRDQREWPCKPSGFKTPSCV